MYYTTLLLSSAAMVSLVAAAEPNCLAGSRQTSVESFTASFNTFCNNQTPTAVIGGITFTFEGTGCKQATCVENFNKFPWRCSFNGNTLSSGGDITTDCGCGKYTFHIGAATNPGLPTLPRSIFNNSTASNNTIPIAPVANSTTLTPISLPTATPQPTVVSPPSPPAATKPTASPLPTGAASLAKVSGGLIVGIAAIFVTFL